MNTLQKLLSLGSESHHQEKAPLPCVMLPGSECRFFDRVQVFAHFDSILMSESSKNKLHSISLYGLGGVGKSKIALHYAMKVSRSLDAVLWIHAQTSTAIAQSFTDAALRLQLQRASSQNHSENRILVVSWLQHTSEYNVGAQIGANQRVKDVSGCSFSTMPSLASFFSTIGP